LYKILFIKIFDLHKSNHIYNRPIKMECWPESQRNYSKQLDNSYYEIKIIKDKCLVVKYAPF